jgi:uncharacterized membrane protein
MHKGYRAVLALIALNVVVTAVFIALLPEEVPQHYDLEGRVDGTGSKWMNVTWPILAALFGGLLYAVAKHGEPQSEKSMVWASIGSLAFIDAITVFFLSKQLTFDGNDPASTLAWELPLGIGMGALLVFLGNIMPKSNRNMVFGIRTFSSMSSEQAWQKTQRFGGYASIVTGLLLALSGVALKGGVFMLALVGIIVVYAIVCIVASSRFARSNPGTHG